MVDDIKLGGLYRYEDFNTRANRELVRPYPMVAKIIKIHSTENHLARLNLVADNPNLCHFKIVDLLTSSGIVMHEVLMDLTKWTEI